MSTRVRAAAAGVTLVVLCMSCPGDRLIASPEQEAKGKEAFTNRLAKETSPYLLLHAHNPVDWYPWGPEAFAKAKAEGKPIFLSVGYSSCYWCHVMERESFSDQAIAKVLNERFVCVKVDKEERPDVDQVYMTALLALGQGGGWPMSMFLTPDGRPFFGGTYFPPRDHEGREGFASLLGRVVEAWRDQRDALDKDAGRLAAATRRILERSAALRKVPLTREITADGQAALAEHFDPEYGGFGYDAQNSHKPKFPEASNLLFLLERSARAGRTPGEADSKSTARAPMVMVDRTLDHLARGGIRDHLAGGYHRYSTERTWTVPHFEKMLYDNAQLATVYLLAFEATANPRWRAEAEAIFGFVAHSLTGPEGGFYAALDSEVAGAEGQYYVWTRAEVRKVLGNDAEFDVFARVYGLDRDPNFEDGRYVLFEPLERSESAKVVGLPPGDLETRLAPLRAKLLAEREKRAGPLRDDKVLTAWNGLMIAAYAEGYRVLKDPRYRAAAEKAADFLLATLRTADGRLLRTYRAGQAKLPAYLEDYAFLAHGLLRLHAATADSKRLEQARVLVDRMLSDFADPKEGGFYFTASDHESLFSKAKEPYDTALPSGNSVAIRCLIALSRQAGEAHYLDTARQALTAFSNTLAENPTGAPLM
ncbi:MAG TPA: thioredoxin domain-containing protein, partial [Isosphaeraceae bacterium]|nr:thioredoxin domain-containing protein [Isosphaeraceae bacterium]